MDEEFFNEKQKEALKFFNDNLSKWVNDPLYNLKYIIIYENKVSGIFDKYDEALTDAIEKYQYHRDDFIIMQVIKSESNEATQDNSFGIETELSNIDYNLSKIDDKLGDIRYKLDYIAGIQLYLSKIGCALYLICAILFITAIFTPKNIQDFFLFVLKRHYEAQQPKEYGNVEDLEGSSEKQEYQPLPNSGAIFEVEDSAEQKPKKADKSKYELF